VVELDKTARVVEVNPFFVFFGWPQFDGAEIAGSRQPGLTAIGHGAQLCAFIAAQKISTGISYGKRAVHAVPCPQPFHQPVVGTKKPEEALHERRKPSKSWAGSSEDRMHSSLLVKGERVTKGCSLAAFPGMTARRCFGKGPRSVDRRGRARLPADRAQGVFSSSPSRQSLVFTEILVIAP